MNRRNILIDIDNTLTKIDYTLRTMEDYFKVGRKEVEDIYTFNLNQVYEVLTVGCSAELLVHNPIYTAFAKYDVEKF